MKIDTRYAKDGSTLVDIVPESGAERALTDDQLARIGCNQDRLNWLGDGDEVALPEEDLRFLPLPPGCTKYVVHRKPDGAVSVEYAPAPEESAHGYALALAATLAIAFGTVAELRYNDPLPDHHLIRCTANTCN